MFQAIVGFSLRQRLFVLVTTAILVGWGALVARDLPIELLPETRPPAVVILAEAPTLAAEDVERLVTVPIEAAMHGLPGATGLRSSSNAGASVVQVMFAWGTDPYRNRQLVSERLAGLGGQLPEGVVPLLAPRSSATGTIVELAVTGSAGPMALREYVDWVLRPRLLAVEGVSEVSVIGGEVRTTRFTPRPLLMEDKGVTLAEVERALTAFGGNTVGLDDMRSLVVAYRLGAPVLLGQLGEVGFAPRAQQGDGSFNGKPSVNVQIIRQPDANTVAVAGRIAAALEALRPTVPAGVVLGQISYSQADMIRGAIGNLGRLLLEAAVLVAVVLLVFLADPRPAAVSLLAIPVSLLVSAIVFRLLGLSLNTMTLGGIAIGLGELVDDSVVDVENILRRLGGNRNLAAPAPAPVPVVIARASQEVRSGIVQATVIILLVCLPLLALPGQPGRLFAPLAIAYIVAILASLLVSVTLTPVLASYLFPHMRGLEVDHLGRFARWLRQRHERLLVRVLDRPRSMLAFAVLAVVASMASLPLLPRSFLPQFNEGNITVRLLLNPSLSASESFRIGHLAEQILMQIPEVKAISRRSGGDDAETGLEPVKDNEMPLRIQLDQGRSLQELMAEIRRRLAIFSADLDVSQFLVHRMESQDHMVRGEVVVKLFGPDLPALRTLAVGLRDRMAQVNGLADVALEQQGTAPQPRLAIDAARARALGITPAQISAIQAAFANGHTVAQVTANGRRFDVTVRLADEDRTADALARVLIDSPAGRGPLSAFATLAATTGPGRILRENGERRVAVMANLDGGADTTLVAAQVRDIIARAALPAGIHAELAGDFTLGEQGRPVLAGLGALAIVLIFVVLQQRFRSTVLSLIVMGSIPLALVGSVIALWIAGLDLNLAAIIGGIAVTGLTVRNALLKVSHFINLHLHEGMNAGRELVLRGANERLIPVLLTASAAGVALLPLLFAAGVPGAEILHPVAVAVFGGLISATLLDTFTTPMLFERFGIGALDRMIASHAGLAHETF